MTRKKKSAQEKRLLVLDAQTEKQKKAMIMQLRRTPIVQVACERTDVGRATYYKWRAKDRVFARAADRAIHAGRFFINDLAESKLIRLIQGDNLTAIIFWLKNNHPKYVTVNRFIHEYEIATERPSVEESAVSALEMAKIFARDITPQETPEEVKERVEEAIAEAQWREPDRQRQEFLEEDPEEGSGSPKA